MKIFVIGTRGIPAIPGGVEKHCEELYPRLVERGHSVILCCRDSYATDFPWNWKGVGLVYSLAPRFKCLEAIVHTFMSLIKARAYRPDLVHIHAIGPSLLVPLARLMGFRVIMTHHGSDYERKKWGRVAKTMLQWGEKLGGSWANEVIVISHLIAKTVAGKCRRHTNLIHNGVTMPERSERTDFLESLDVQPGSYILAVARFVEEKGLHDLMRAYRQLDYSNKLVVVGDADHETDYSRELRRMAAEDNRIVLTGYLTGERLNQVYSYARLFVLPSYHEGLPIVLLEALSYGLPVLVSDIPANKEVRLPTDRYFRCGDVSHLRSKIESLMRQEWINEERRMIRRRIEEKYNWDRIAEQTINVYRKALSQQGV